MASTITSLLLTASDVAVLLGISKRQVFRLSSAGQLPGRVKVGRLTRWRREDVQRWIEAGCPKRQ
jgi:excisionase family DNA binding protein